VRCVGCGEYDRPRRYALLGQAVVNVGGRQQAKAAVVVLGVVLNMLGLGDSPAVGGRERAKRRSI
jgi:hypothetical protein